MNAIPETTTPQKTAITLGFWSAIFASVFTLLFVLIAITTSLFFPMKAWNGIQAYVENFNFLDMASFIPAFFLAPTMVILIACINAIAPESKKIFSLIGLAFLHSTFFALETLGYAFLSLATLFVSSVFTSGKLEIWIRSLFIVSGAVGILGVLVAPFDQPYLVFAGLGLWSLAFPISTILLSIFFRRIEGN